MKGTKMQHKKSGPIIPHQPAKSGYARGSLRTTTQTKSPPSNVFNMAATHAAGRGLDTGISSHKKALASNPGQPNR